MVENPLVAVVAPISDKKEYVIDKWLKHIFQLTYPNFVIILVDNSPKKDLYSRLKRQYPEISSIRHFSPKNLTSVMYITHSQNILVSEAKLFGAEYFMSIECDVFPPKNVIELLLAHKSPIACGVYPYMDGVKRKPLLITIEEDITGHIRHRNREYAESLLFMDGKPKYNFGQGIGCALIDMRVFNFVSFRFEKDMEHHSDTFFYQDLYFRGIDPVVDTSIVCRHENSDWAETKKEDEELLAQIHK
jgi:hypothetical protein